MAVWEIEGVSNDYTGFYAIDDADLWAETFIMDGSPRKWSVPPRLHPGLEKNKKKQKPLADISYTAPGRLVLNPKAHAALKDFLSPFGQFLEVECLNAGGLLGDNAIHSQIHYFYNVTNIIHCIDANLPENREKMAWEKPIFNTEDLPTGGSDLQRPVAGSHQYLPDRPGQRNVGKSHRGCPVDWCCVRTSRVSAGQPPFLFLSSECIQGLSSANALS